MEKPQWDIGTAADFQRSAKKAKEALKHVKKGEVNNVIDMRKEFTRSMFYNNRDMFNKLDTEQKEA